MLAWHVHLLVNLPFSTKVQFYWYLFLVFENTKILNLQVNEHGIQASLLKITSIKTIFSSNVKSEYIGV